MGNFSTICAAPRPRTNSILSATATLSKMDALNNFFLTSPLKAWLPAQTVKPTVDAHLNKGNLDTLKRFIVD